MRFADHIKDILVKEFRPDHPHWVDFLGMMEENGSTRMIVRKNEAGEVEDYLKRHYILNTPEKSVVLHQFWTSDLDGLHDHPWDNETVVLAGSYIEHTPNGPKLRRVGDKVYRNAEDLHRIEVPPDVEGGSVWTLFTYFERRRDWGFETPQGWMRADRYGEMIGVPIGKFGDNYRLEGTLFPKFVDLRDGPQGERNRA